MRAQLRDEPAQLRSGAPPTARDALADAGHAAC
jgi:hypothetical protein